MLTGSEGQHLQHNDEDECDGGVAYRGPQFHCGLTVLIRENGHSGGIFSSAEHAQRPVGRRHPLELIWLAPISPP